MTHFWFSLLALGCAWAGLARVRATTNPGRQRRTSKTGHDYRQIEIPSVPARIMKRQRKWPLVIFLHGAGETGADLNMVKKHGHRSSSKKGFSFILISPQAHAAGTPEAVNGLVDDVIATYRVDRSGI